MSGPRGAAGERRARRAGGGAERRRALPAADRLGRRDEQDRHHGGVVVPPRAPVAGVAGDEPQHQAGHRDQRDRRPERDERRRQQQHHDGRQLDRPAGVQPGEQGADGARLPADAAGDRAAGPAPVAVLVQRVEVRDDHGDREDRPEQPPPEQGHPAPERGVTVVIRRRPTGRSGALGAFGHHRAAGSSDGNIAVAIISPAIAATVKPWSSFTNTSGIAHRMAAPGRRRTSADTENASSGTRQRDLVEVEVDHLLQAPGEHVREPDQPP